jgi:hypothetical protein
MLTGVMPNFILTCATVFSVMFSVNNAFAQAANIYVNASQILHTNTSFMTGACLEDVNHEIYGGLYSQMIFGESFAEPPRVSAPRGFEAFGGRWEVRDGRLIAAAGEGPKLVSQRPAFAVGEVGVEVKFADNSAGLAGLILKVDKPAVGADRWIGYEVSLDARRQVMVLGRHRNNWEHIKDVACKIPVGQWIKLSARLTDESLEVLVDGVAVFKHEGVKQLPAGFAADQPKGNLPSNQPTLLQESKASGSRSNPATAN